jgi:hypothetical protein
VLICPKNFFFTKFENGYQNKAEFYAYFETVEKNAKNYTSKLFAKNFFWMHFYSIISAYFAYSHAKKELKFWGH